MSERVKLADAGLITSLSDTDNMLLESGGSMRRAALSTFTDKVMGDMNADMITEDIMIAYKTATICLSAKLSDWPALQRAGQMAVGVLVSRPGLPFVVSPTEVTGYTWASGNKVYDVALDISEAMQDLDGETHTANAVANSSGSYVCDTADYGPGYCHQYERVDSAGIGIAAGNWWMPSLGELMLIYANFAKINYALSLIDGADQVGPNTYLSSSESSANGAWGQYFGSGTFGNNTKATSAGRIRPVTRLYK